MMLTAQREIAKRIPEANFFSRLSSNQVGFAYHSGLQPSIARPGKLGKAGRLALAALRNSHIRRALSTNLVSAYEILQLKHIDSVLDASGMCYSDVWGPEFANRGWAWVRYCSDTQKPYLCMPQVWGPFSNPKVAQPVRQVCNHANAVYVRDTVSHGHLVELLGSNASRVKVAPDIVFRFKGACKEVGVEVLSAYGIKAGDRPIIGITPNIHIYNRTPGDGVCNKYLKLLVTVARHCMSTWDAAIVLIPHAITLGPTNQFDDRYLCGLINTAIRDQGPVANLTDFYFADTMKSIIGNLDLLLGSRFHSLVFALSSNVPVVALSWAYKYRELMQLVDQGDFVIEHEQLHESAIIELMDRVWEHRSRNKAQIAQALPRIQSKVDATFEDVARLIQAGSN